MENKKNWLKIILFSLIGIFLLSGTFYAGYWLGTNSNLKTQISKPQLKTQNLTPAPKQPSPTPDPAADWKTYRNEKYKYSFNYPPNLNIEDKSVESINQFEIISQKGRKIIIYAKKGNKQPYYLDHSSSGKINFGKLMGEKYVLPKGYCDGPDCTPPIIAAVVYNEGFKYVFSVQGDTGFNDIENKILSTFQFLD